MRVVQLVTQSVDVRVGPLVALVSMMVGEKVESRDAS